MRAQLWRRWPLRGGGGGFGDGLLGIRLSLGGGGFCFVWFLLVGLISRRGGGGGTTDISVVASAAPPSLLLLPSAPSEIVVGLPTTFKR